MDLYDVVMEVSIDATLSKLVTDISQTEKSKVSLAQQPASFEVSLTRAEGQHTTVAYDRNAPISRLPAEILAKIFVAGVNEEARITHRRNPPFEILVSQITAHWRHVALRTPSLWCVIDISLTRTLNSLNNYISRSGVCALTIRFDYAHTFWVPDPPIWDLIFTHAHRWQSLLIFSNVRLAAIKITLGHLEQLSPPILREFRLIQGSDPGSSMWNSGGNNFHGFHYAKTIFGGCAPRLSFVELEGAGLDCGWPPLSFITTLYIHNLHPTTRFRWAVFKEFLVSARNLTTLSIYGSPITGWPSRRSSIIELPSLHALRLRNTDEFGRNASILLLSIFVPNLETLVLMDFVEDDLSSFFLAPQTSSRFSYYPCLRLLTFQWNNFSSNIYTKFFDAFPSITHFALFDHHPNGNLSLLGDYNRKSSLPFPDLQELSIYPASAHGNRIRELVHARLTGQRPRPLTRLRTDYDFEHDQWLSNHVKVIHLDAPSPWPNWP